MPPAHLVARKLRCAIQRVQRSLQSDPNGYLRRCRSIVHVGANSGQERELYAKYDLDVLWIEPIPTVYERLLENIRPHRKQKAVRALVTDQDGGIQNLNIASNEGASSSILDLALHKDIWPDIHYVDRVEMDTITLDTLLRQFGSPSIDAIILDTQGSELLVLKGGTQTLARLKYVRTECADFESYTGCATVQSISEFLDQHGYVLKRKDRFVEQHPNGGGYYDALFLKH